jgi:ABC-type polysaccharide/polyol phosphate export permease
VSSQAISPEDEYLGEHHVYEPHRAGLPKMRPYFRELWRRKSFAFELSHTEMHAANTDTFFGQAWLVINPLLLASVYFVLVEIIGGKSQPPTFFAHLTSGIFLFYFVSGSMLSGASSVVSGGRLIMNTSFPKMLLPISATYTAFRRFLPTLAVYAVLHVMAGLPIGPHLLWVPVVLLEAACFALGLAMLFATLQVYFRDAKSFLPYGVRIWLYLTPVLWFADAAPKRLLPILPLNPLYGIMGSWSQVLIEGHSPSKYLLALGAAWSLGTLLAGGLYFMSREREFAVRI